MFDTLSAPYMQRALVEILLLAVLAGVLGAWIVLRRLAFFTHSVGTATFPGLVVASAWGIAPQLAAHLDLMLEQGYQPITVRQLLDGLATGQLPPRPVVLTFDDGFADFAANAWPLLTDRGLAATLYVTAGDLGVADVVTATSIPEAMNAIDRNRLDAAVLDLHLARVVVE